MDARHPIGLPLADARRDAGAPVGRESSMSIVTVVPRMPARSPRRSMAAIAIPSSMARPSWVGFTEMFSKSWPQYELDGLVTMANSGRQVLLPLWHGVSQDEVMNYSPSLADKVALRTIDSTIDEIAEEIAIVVQGLEPIDQAP
jgi:hypothetical protein